jgi:hypothetical protein
VSPPLRVWIASFPRSGNTFLRVVLNALYGLPSETIYPGEWAGMTKAWGATLPRSDADLREPRPSALLFTKTHEPPGANDGGPAFYVVRDGRDAYVSYAHFARMMDPARYAGASFVEVLRQLVASGGHFSGWSGHVDAWTRRRAPTAVLRFEQLLAAPAEAVERAAERLGLSLPAASGFVPTFAELKAWKPKSFRNGVVGAWRDEMPADVEALFWKLHGATMEGLGYARGG